MSATVLLIGIRIARLYRRRVAFWEQMNGLCGFICNEIRYTADCPANIFERFTWREEIWMTKQVSYFEFLQCLSRLEQRLLLSKDEDEQVIGFYQGLGTTDLEGQLAHCGRYSRLFSHQVEQAQNLYATKGKLYRSLCALASGMLAVLLI